MSDVKKDNGCMHSATQDTGCMKDITQDNELMDATALLNKLTGPQLVNKFPTFYGNRQLITAFKKGHHFSLPSAI
jgi:hypothetical protein